MSNKLSANLYHEFLQKITLGHWAIGKPIPSSRVLAKTHGVGIKVVRLAIGKLIREGRLQNSPRRRPIVTLSANVSSVFKKSIALVLSTELLTVLKETSCRGAMLNKLIECISKTSWTVLTLQNSRWRNEFPEGLRELPLQGIVLIGPFRMSLLRQYATLPVPVIALDQPIAENLNIHTIAVANYDASFDATTRLIALGHRRLAFVRTFTHSYQNVDPDSQERCDGFTAACRAVGLNDEAYRIFTAGYIDNVSPTIIDIFAVKPRYTALVLSDGFHTKQINMCLKAARLSVPADCSIVAFEGTATSKLIWSGPKIDFSEFGRRAFELIENPPATPQHIRVLPCWHEGGSVETPGK